MLKIRAHIDFGVATCIISGEYKSLKEFKESMALLGYTIIQIIECDEITEGEIKQ